jgi:chromosome segregation ATPase
VGTDIAVEIKVGTVPVGRPSNAVQSGRGRQFTTSIEHAHAGIPRIPIFAAGPEETLVGAGVNCHVLDRVLQHRAQSGKVHACNHINELEIALDHANKANSEAHKSIKRYQGQLREVEGGYEEEKRGRIEIAEKAGLAERKANALQGELEESRSLLDSADRGKKQTELELGEARAAVNDMTAINSKAASEKRACESAVHSMHAEIDDMLQQAKNSEEKSKKAMVDAARLADELRSEQDHSGAQEKGKRALETQIIELENRLAEANDLAVKGGRNAMAKLESRIREMEIELGGVQSKTSETYKSFQKSERRIKELAFQRDEDKKNADRITELAQKLQQKIKTYKKQIEEAEEIAALNLAKYRKAQQELEETEDRSRMAEGALSVVRQSAGLF